MKRLVILVFGLLLNLSFSHRDSSVNGLWIRVHLHEFGSSAKTTDSLILNNGRFTWKSHSNKGHRLSRTGHYDLNGDTMEISVQKESVGLDFVTGQLIFRNLKPARRFKFVEEIITENERYLTWEGKGAFRKSSDN